MSSPQLQLPLLGAQVFGGTTRFGAFVTTATTCEVRLLRPGSTQFHTYPMHPLDPTGGHDRGYFEAIVTDAGHGTLYTFILDGERELPDPYARFLPQGVMGPAMVVEPKHKWKHDLRVTRPMSDYLIYELHVGTFSAAGTYQGILEHIPHIVSLGITAVELMPVAAFAGARGWGYDGVAAFAPHAGYGAPDDLRALVDALHSANLSVILDVVYNHFGPEGNFLSQFSPHYFTSEVKNGWGEALNYAHPVMRRLLLESAHYWLEGFHLDALRLDATHAIVDPSSEHVLHKLSRQISELSPKRFLFAEDERNEPGVIQELGFGAVWADDFHHAVRVTMTEEQDGYFAAYPPNVTTVAETINHGWLYRGQNYSPNSLPRGKPADALKAESLIYCIQNHDQIGNRALGDRLNAMVSPDAYRAVSTLLLFLPMTPLLFMGQEWASSSPFLFFTDYGPELGKTIAKHRRDEFRFFSIFADPLVRERIPNPQDLSTFERSRLNWTESENGESARTLNLYRELIALRRSDPVLKQASRSQMLALVSGQLLVVTRTNPLGSRILVVNFTKGPLPLPDEASYPTSQPLIASDGHPGGRQQIPAQTAVIMAKAP